MGNLSGRFIRVYTHAYGPYLPSEDHFTHLRIKPLTNITGTLNVPAHDGTGLIFITVFRYDGSFNSTPENRVGGTVIYPDDYSEEMIYTVTDLPPGEQVFVSVWWDADFNGVVTPGDYVSRAGPVTVAEGGSTVADVDVTVRYAGGEGPPYFSTCNVMAMHTPDGVQTTAFTQVFDSNGTVPDTITSLTVSGPGGSITLSPRMTITWVTISTGRQFPSCRLPENIPSP